MKHMLGAACALAMVLGFSSLASAAGVMGEGVMGNVENGRNIFMNGKGDTVTACQSCHGVDGLGSDDMGTPRLAYQVDTYILKQLTDFATDKRTDNIMFTMNDIAKGLTEQERRDMAAYVHSLKNPFMGSNLDELAANDVKVGQPYKGEIIAQYGLPDHGVPACKSCHSYDGRSAGRLYPAIADQRYVYLVSQLKAFRDGSRANDFKGQMAAVAKHLTDEDIHNVASFLTSAKVVTPGNPRAPARQ